MVISLTTRPWWSLEERKVVKMQVYLRGKVIKLDPKKSIGKGGEADVFDIGNYLALKAYKLPNHPDLTGNLRAQKAARERIEEHQKKLRVFPKNLPPRVITPIDLITDTNGQVVGYTMKLLAGTEALLRYSDKGFRQTGIDNNAVIKTFLDIYETLESIHKRNVVVGDFNDLNVLIRDNQAYFIDTDSFQFGSFMCRLFTERFVDPLLCDSREQRPILIKPYNVDSDWFAYAIMLMQSLLYVGPYGGIYKPKNRLQRIVQPARSLRRITVFHPDVKYPKPATHYDVLPDDLIEKLRLIFEKDERGSFPKDLIENIRWTKCIVCGAEHARNICPECSHAAIKETVRIHGKVTVRESFRTKGIILEATTWRGNLYWVYHEDGELKREGGKTIAYQSLDPKIRFRVMKNNTLIAKNHQLINIGTDGKLIKLVVDTYRNTPIFGTNSENYYWLTGGRLMRNGAFADEIVGQVLENQTLFWIGEKFGFGFYRAGQIQTTFVFDAKAKTINDSIKLPRITGELINANCYFGTNRCWFFIITQNEGKIYNECIVIGSKGEFLAHTKEEKGENSWLESVRGKTTSGDFLLVATDEGVVRIETANKQLIIAKEFPDTEPFISQDCWLFTAKDGVYVVDRKSVKLLQIN